MNIFDDEAELESDQELLLALVMLAEAGLTITETRANRAFLNGGTTCKSMTN